MEQFIPTVEEYVTEVLGSQLSTAYVYHNMSHTLRVVELVKELAFGEDLAPNDANLVIVAAWLHDIGYVAGAQAHEERSAAMAKSFLEDLGIPTKDIDTVTSLIRATQMGHQPKSDLERIIRDADCGYVSNPNYSDISQLLRIEWGNMDDKSFTDKEWIEENIRFLTHGHKFHTAYALQHWQSLKDKNLVSLYKQLRKEEVSEQKGKKKNKELSLKETKAKLPERGIETLFRVTLQNHTELSSIADTKANILLSVNAIIISMVLANLIPKLDNPSNAYLIYPTVIFTVFTVTSMICSIIATRPIVTEGSFNMEDVKNKKVNILFFGNFHKMKLQDYETAMQEVMKDRDYLYGSLTKDLYFLGKVLDKKYRILRVTYTIFMIGIIVSVISFSIAFHLNA